jgi:hypothetical protein
LILSALLSGCFGSGPSRQFEPPLKDDGGTSPLPDGFVSDDAAPDPSDADGATPQLDSAATGDGSLTAQGANETDVASDSQASDVLCDDVDGDGFGPGCVLGGDCNSDDNQVFQWVMRLVDADNDGYGGGTVEFVCAGHAPLAQPLPGDCDDLNPFASPGAIDLPDDGVDQDCDGQDLRGTTLNAVYVAEGGRGPGTATEPLGNLHEAVALAKQQGVPVLMAAGTYHGTTTSVSLFGGYQRHDGVWTRERGGEPTVIEGMADQHGRNIALIVDSEAPLVLDGLWLRAGDATGAGFTNGLRLNRAAEVTIAFCDITGGRSINQSIGLRINDPDGRVTVRSSRIHGGEGRRTRGVWTHTSLTLYGNDINGGDASEEHGIGLFVEAGPAAWVANNVIAGGSGPQTAAVGISSFLVSSQQTPEPVVMAHNLMRSRSAGEGDSTGLFLFDALPAVDQGPLNVVLVNNIITAGPGVARFRGLSRERGQLWLLHNLWAPVEPGLGALVDGEETFVSTEDELNDCTSEAWQWGTCLQSQGNRVALPGLDGDFLGPHSPGLNLGTDPRPWYDGVGVGVDRLGRRRAVGKDWDVGPYEGTQD